MRTAITRTALPCPRSSSTPSEEGGYEPWRPVYRMGAKTALERVATRIGVPDLHERAQAAAARQTDAGAGAEAPCPPTPCSPLL